MSQMNDRWHYKVCIFLSKRLTDILYIHGSVSVAGILILLAGKVTKE